MAQALGANSAVNKRVLNCVKSGTGELVEEFSRSCFF
jgi:hypothetical protein